VLNIHFILIKNSNEATGVVRLKVCVEIQFSYLFIFILWEEKIMTLWN